MIKYIEKGKGLHEAIAKAGYVLYERDNVWVTDNEVAVQKIIDEHVVGTSEEEQAEIKQALIEIDIKSIRSIREYILSVNPMASPTPVNPMASPTLQALENQAQNERAKIKK